MFSNNIIKEGKNNYNIIILLNIFFGIIALVFFIINFYININIFSISQKYNILLRNNNFDNFLSKLNIVLLILIIFFFSISGILFIIRKKKDKYKLILSKFFVIKFILFAASISILISYILYHYLFFHRKIEESFYSGLNNFRATTWLINYQDFGFIKRGLPGTIHKIFFNEIAGNYICILISSSIILISLLILIYLLILKFNSLVKNKLFLSNEICRR